MKRIITGALFLTTLLTAFTSCKKDNDNGPGNDPGSDPVPATVQLKEFDNGDEFIRFTYNADGTVQKATLKSELNTGDDQLEYTVSYNAAKKIESLTTSYGSKIQPVYENGVLTRADMFQAGERLAYTNYVFTNGRLSKASIYANSDAGFIPILEFDFTYNAAGNISRTVSLTASGDLLTLVPSGHVDYQYDQKQNPLYEQRDILALFWQAASRNNIIQEDHFDASQQPADKFVYTYKYKSNGLPETAVVTQGLPGQPQTTSNISFVY